MRKLISLLILILCTVITQCWASEIHVQALFKDKAVIEMDGQIYVLHLGQDTAGVKLISADSQQCVILVEGQEKVFTLNDQVSVNYSPTQTPTVRIQQDEHGLYRVNGKINGHATNFIVDTGASVVALNAKAAKEFGVIVAGRAAQVVTASGKTKGTSTLVQEISVGGIKVYNVEAVVLEGSEPSEALLGASFLKRVDMSEREHVLEMQQKY